MNTLADFDTLQKATTYLRPGEVYFYRKIQYNPKGPPDEAFFQVTILGRARLGTYGDRVKCSDGKDRYSSGSFAGRNSSVSHRVDDLTLVLKKGKTYLHPRVETPHVQLDLFDAIAAS